MEIYDAIVVGTGGVGSAALYQLAKAGLKVLGLDQFAHAHAKGSSHGQSRIIRQAYFEHPDYVPLLLRAYTLWDQVERASGQKLFNQVGLLEAGPQAGQLIPGVMQSVTAHGLPIETMTAAEARAKYAILVPDQLEVVFEPTAGYLLVEPCVQAHLDLAVREGAIWSQQRVEQWTVHTNHVTVHTASETYQAQWLVVCGGAWSATLLSGLGVPLQVVSKHLYWFAETTKASRPLPTFFFELPEGYFYGFPAINELGIKVAQHSGGEKHDGPVDLDGLVDKQDELAVLSFTQRYLPRCNRNPRSQQACMYTLSPDEHFVVDRHPDWDHVVFAAGLSGHGFKFAPVLGEALTALVTGERYEPSIDFLGVHRFSGSDTSAK